MALRHVLPFHQSLKVYQRHNSGCDSEIDYYSIGWGVFTSLARVASVSAPKLPSTSHYRTYSYNDVARGSKMQPVKDEISVSVCISTKT